MPALPASLALTSIATGADILSADHRNNYAAIQQRVNDMLAALAVSAKGDLLVATASGVLINVPVGVNGLALVADSSQSSGVKWGSTGVKTYRNGSQVDVASSIAETSLVDENIAANDLGTDKIARATIFGDFLQNVAGNITIRIKFGGTTVWADTVAFPTSATRRRFKIEVNVGNRGATNSQDIDGFIRLGNVNATTSGLGDIATVDVIETTVGAAADPAIDTTAAQHLIVSAQWDTNSASLSFRKRYSIVEVVG